MKKQSIIIIGATSGIGRALFEKYAVEGNRIGIVGRRTYMLDELRQEHPDTTITATADITKLDEIAQTIDALRIELKDIDLAIVCSGTGDINASLDYAVERPTIDTNVMGWTYVVDILYNILEQQVVAVFLTLTVDIRVGTCQRTLEWPVLHEVPWCCACTESVSVAAKIVERKTLFIYVFLFNYLHAKLQKVERKTKELILFLPRQSNFAIFDSKVTIIIVEFQTILLLNDL